MSYQSFLLPKRKKYRKTLSVCCSLSFASFSVIRSPLYSTINSLLRISSTAKTPRPATQHVQLQSIIGQVLALLFQTKYAFLTYVIINKLFSYPGWICLCTSEIFRYILSLAPVKMNNKQICYL